MATENINLEYFRGKNFHFHINRGLSAFSVRDLLKYPDDYKFDFDVFLPTLGMNLQRPLVWTSFQKSQLIISILKGIKLPNMTLIQKAQGSGVGKDRVFQVIDGKQRLSTILNFANNKFPIEIGGGEFFFNHLPQDCRREILGYCITCDMGYEYDDASIADDDKVRWFELLNFAGTPQDAKHMETLRGVSVKVA